MTDDDFSLDERERINWLMLKEIFEGASYEKDHIKIPLDKKLENFLKSQKTQAGKSFFDFIQSKLPPDWSIRLDNQWLELSGEDTVINADKIFGVLDGSGKRLGISSFVYKGNFTANTTTSDILLTDETKNKIIEDISLTNKEGQNLTSITKRKWRQRVKENLSEFRKWVKSKLVKA